MEQGRRVFVTGAGLLSGEAGDPGELWSHVMAGRKVPGAIPSDTQLSQGIGLPAGDSAILARHQILALAAVDDAWRSADLVETRNRLRGEGEKIGHPGFGCVGGSSLGGLVAMEHEIAERGDARFSPYALSRWRGNSVTAAAALRHGLRGPVISLNAASATGAQCLWMAGSLVRGGLAEAIVAVAADPVPSPLVGAAMGRNGSVSTKASSLPLSGERSGMTPSEGAACLILESEAHALARRAKPLAEWLGGGCLNEACHLQAPDPKGSGLKQLIRQLLSERSCSVEDIDWISLHATGTNRYDAIEAAVISSVFGERLPWISAFKRTTGHALSASGLIEGVLLVEGISRGEVPPLPHSIDHAFGLKLPGASEGRSPSIALQIGQGMGGDLVVNLLSRP